MWDPILLLQGLIQYACLLFSLSVHESAHAWTASRCGDPTARYLGRISLNPVAHVDLLGTVVFPLIMIFSSIPLIGWAKPVPVNPRNLRRPRSHSMWVAAAGPLSNLGLCVLFFLALAVMVRVFPPARSVLSDHLRGEVGIAGGPPHLLEPLVLFLLYAVFLNALLAVFNLLPTPPLDGGAILLGLLPAPVAERLEGWARFGFLFLFLLLATGALNLLFSPFSSAITHALSRIAA